MKWKIYEHLIFPNLWEDLVALVKKLCFSVDDEITIWVTDSSFSENINVSFFKWKEQKSIVSSFTKITEYDTLQEKFKSNCNYCRKYDHREWDCLKKKSDIFFKKLQFISHITDSNWVANLTFSHKFTQSVVKIRRTKSTSVISRRRLWLTVHFTERSVITVLNSVSDLNLICKNISKSLTSVFKVSSLQYAEDQSLQTYSVYHEKVEVKNSFKDWRQTYESFTFADLDMSLILRLPWLQQNNSKIDFVKLTVQWRTVTENNQLSFSTEKTFWDSLTRKFKDLQMNYMMQRLQVMNSED